MPCTITIILLFCFCITSVALAWTFSSLLEAKQTNNDDVAASNLESIKLFRNLHVISGKKDEIMAFFRRLKIQKKKSNRIRMKLCVKHLNEHICKNKGSFYQWGKLVAQRILDGTLSIV